MAEKSLEHRPFELSHTRARRASASSSEQSSATDDKSTSSNPRRRRASPALGVHQPTVAASSEPSRRRSTKHASTGPREKSSKRSSMTMTAPAPSDPAGEVTYTPTTHRISKAKKGKKVHVCEVPGCGKVFTRAEHRKRHQANHNPEFAFQCQFEECGKGFQRADLLARHMERQHDGTSRAPGAHRSTSETSSNPPAGSIMPATMGQPQPVPAQAISHGPGAMAITSIIEHPMHELAYPAQSMGDLTHTGVGPIPVSYAPEWAYGAMHSGDSPRYSSDNCSSPMSDYPNAQISYQPFQDAYDGSYAPTPRLCNYPSPMWVANNGFPYETSQPHQQTIVHMEMFVRFRARSAKVEYLQGSPQFRSLYSSLITDQNGLQRSAASLQRALSVMDAPAQLHAAHYQWIDFETRRRILVASFVLDTQHSHLFQQQPSYNGTLGEDGLDVPFPSSAEVWNCLDIFTWRDLITSQQALTVSSVDYNLPPLDPFQSSLLTCHQIYCSPQFDNPAQRDIIYHPTKSHIQTTTLTYQALSLSSYIPLHALIITASESWLFGTKITDEAVWQQAKTTLRGWVTGHAAMKAVWYATQLLRLDFQNQSQQQHHIEGIGYLHNLWSLYIAALVCWAFGFGNTPGLETQQDWRPENAEVLAANYLCAMNVPTWQDVRNVSKAMRRSTRGLLEFVRGKIGEVGMGGILNGAEDVLFRLVEGESEMVKF
ncbi:MAG: hypothetical protein LQ338_005650 [Usnochroma carphineum]|nr:MAG: hypothetical protein LQ338_005650 [Usnochroma carphineum]